MGVPFSALRGVHMRGVEVLAMHGALALREDEFGDVVVSTRPTQTT